MAKKIEMSLDDIGKRLNSKPLSEYNRLDWTLYEMIENLDKLEGNLGIYGFKIVLVKEE